MNSTTIGILTNVNRSWSTCSTCPSSLPASKAVLVQRTVAIAWSSRFQSSPSLRIARSGVVWSCVLAILIGSPPCQGPAPGWGAGLGVRMRPSYIDDELAVADDAGEVTVFRELEEDVALFSLGLVYMAVLKRTEQSLTCR